MKKIIALVLSVSLATPVCATTYWQAAMSKKKEAALLASVIALAYSIVRYKSGSSLYKAPAKAALWEQALEMLDKDVVGRAGKTEIKFKFAVDETHTAEWKATLKESGTSKSFYNYVEYLYKEFGPAVALAVIIIIGKDIAFADLVRNTLPELFTSSPAATALLASTKSK